MIEKIDIKDASIAEEIRKQMAVATSDAKGLLSDSLCKTMNHTIVGINPGETISIKGVFGLAEIINKYIDDGVALLCVVGNTTVTKIGGSSLSGLNISVKDNSLIIKSNWSSAGSLSIFYQNLPS